MHVEMSALAALTTEKDIALEELIYAIEVAVLGAYNQTDTAKRHAARDGSGVVTRLQIGDGEGPPLPWPTDSEQE